MLLPICIDTETDVDMYMRIHIYILLFLHYQRFLKNQTYLVRSLKTLKSLVPCIKVKKSMPIAHIRVPIISSLAAKL